MNNEATTYIFRELNKHMQKPTTELEQARGMIRTLNEDRAALLNAQGDLKLVLAAKDRIIRNLRDQLDELLPPGYKLNLIEGAFTPVPQDILHSSLMEMLTTYASEYEAIVTKHYTAYVKRMDDEARIASRWDD
jgi:hypothetical protein